MKEKDFENLKNLWPIILNISQMIFEVSLILYLTLFLLDEIKEDFVSNFFNLNYLLIICIISGAIAAKGAKNNEKQTTIKSLKIKKRDYVLMAGLAILAVIIVFIKIKEIGVLAWPISFLSGILIFLISYLFLKEGEES